jgi:KaiC/GvpD/RAD55 family RecA-like ATPase
MSKAAFLSTGISALDALLGGQGILRGSTILLRGEPGTGKTTLALQMSRAAIKQGQQVVILSVEQPAKLSLDRITRSLWGYEDFGRFLGSSRSWKTPDLSGYWQDVEREVIRRCVEAMKANSPRSVTGFSGRAEAGKVVSPNISNSEFAQMVEEIQKTFSMDRLLIPFWQALSNKTQKHSFVVIDSLTELIDVAQMRFREHNPRQMFLAILRSFETWHNQLSTRPTVLFSAEDHDDYDLPGAQSYIADTVIRLCREKRKWDIAISEEESADWSGDLLFCQVLKGRGLAVQRRSCCYDFVVKQGITFFPTFASQGLVSLFYENVPQRQEVLNFRHLDCGSSYPGLLVQEFTRSGLQRMFSVRRHAESVPKPHPLMLYNVDEYWVAELRKANLLQSVPARKLKLFSLPLTSGNRPARGTQLIHELREAKGEIFLNEHGDFFGRTPLAQHGFVGLP